MRFGQTRLQVQSRVCFRVRFRFPIFGRLVVMENFRTGGREPRVRERKFRIERDRLPVKLFSRFVVFQERVGVVRNLRRAQIKNVRVRVLRRLRSHAHFFFRTKHGVQRRSDFGCELALQA